MLANWFFGQLLSYSAILPPILLLPGTNRRDRSRAPADTHARTRLETLSPLVSLIIGLVLCFLVGGPGILAFPIPPLLYCTLVYRQHTTAWLTLCTAIVLTLGTAYGWIPFGDDPTPVSADLWAMISLRLGVLLLVVAPLIMSGALAAHGDTISSLNLALDHDVLTGALSRQAFLRGAQACLQNPASSQGTGLLMLDIDHFKQLNDTHGHAAGDLALQAFAQTIRVAIRPRDLFGRLGGEEFGIALPDTTPAETAAIAERLRACVADIAMPSAEGSVLIRTTVSIGAVHDSQQPQATLHTLLSYADQAMYRAKRGGRDCVYFHDCPTAAARDGDPGTPRKPYRHSPALPHLPASENLKHVMSDSVPTHRPAGRRPCPIRLDAADSGRRRPRLPGLRRRRHPARGAARPRAVRAAPAGLGTAGHQRHGSPALGPGQLPRSPAGDLRHQPDTKAI